MSFDKETFSNDIATQDLDYLRSRYRDRIPESTSILDIVDSLERQGLLEQLITRDWCRLGPYKGDVTYLIKTNNIFEVFSHERELRLHIEVFAELKDAAKAYIGVLLNELGHSAPDTKIK